MITKPFTLLCSILFLLKCVTLPASLPQKIVIFAPPKTGTHLFGKLVTKMTNLKGHYHLCEVGKVKKALKLAKNATQAKGFVIAHNWNKKTLTKLAKQGYKVLFTMRDPRDQTISMQDWFREGQWGWMSTSKIADLNEQLEEMITGDRFGWTSASMIFNRYQEIESLTPKHCYVIKYEQLVGPKGGGSREVQIEEINNLAKFLNLQLPQEKIQEIADTLFGGTGTFRKGQIGRWKERFNDRHIELFNKKFQNQLEQFGYTNNCLQN